MQGGRLEGADRKGTRGLRHESVYTLLVWRRGGGVEVGGRAEPDAFSPSPQRQFLSSQPLSMLFLNKTLAVKGPLKERKRG